MTAATACGNCGTEPLENARFCHSCGAAVTGDTQPAEYKQVTVLFADVVHSMDIAAAVGPERLREIMAELVKRSTAVVQRYGGTVDKFTGDGIMAVFGAPVALEDHAVRACLAGLDIQRERPRLPGIELQLRVGLNSGQVIAGEIGSGAAGYTAIGEHVGLAQRMEAVAPPGGVMLSESTARLVEHAALLSELEKVHIKGSEHPVTARRLLGMASSHAVVGQGESKLVGRQWEMTAAESILERSIDGNGAVVALVGPAGIGKSRMVREIAATAAAKGVDIFWAFCESHTSDIPFHVATQLARATVGLPTLDDESVRDRLREGFGDADEQDLVLFEDLLGIRDAATALPNIDPDARRRRLSALVKAATVARETPAIYIVEDAHWIDEVSDTMLADFMTVIPQTHAMAVLTHRPEFKGALAQTPGSQTLTLAPLSNSESATLATELLGSDPSVKDLAETLAAHAAGNPFFAEEIVRDLAERGVISGERGAYSCRTDIADISVPATLQATISARIDRLESSAKRTLCAAAVIGTRFNLDLLSSMGVDPVLEDLLQAELIQQIQFTPRAEYAFRHPLIRTVAYESQLKADRAKLHRQLAESIQERNPEQADENAALIAEHLEAAGDARAAYSWHMRAGGWSMNRDIAAAHVSWERARQIADALPEDEPDRLSMRIGPRTLMCANGFRINKPGAVSRFEELQELCTAGGDKASLAIAMGGVIGDHMVCGHLHEAVQLAFELTTLLESIDAPSLTVGLTVSPAAMAMTRGDMAEFLRLAQMMIDLADSDNAGSPILGSPLAYAYGARSVGRWAHGLDGWREDIHRAVELGGNADPWSQSIAVAIAYGMAVGHNIIQADDTVLHDIQVAMNAAERSADDLALGFALFTMGVGLLQGSSSQIDSGLQLLRQSREMALDGRFYRTQVPLIDAWIGYAMARQGDHDGALAVLRPAIDESFHDGQFAHCVPLTRFVVRELLVGGTEADVRDAEAAIERLAAVKILEGLAIQEITLLELRALLARAKGDEVVYKQLADRYLEMAESLGFEGHIAIARAM